MIIAIVISMLIVISVYIIILYGSMCSREEEKEELEYLKRMESIKNGKCKNK